MVLEADKIRDMGIMIVAPSWCVYQMEIMSHTNLATLLLILSCCASCAFIAPVEFRGIGRTQLPGLVKPGEEHELKGHTLFNHNGSFDSRVGSSRRQPPL